MKKIDIVIFIICILLFILLIDMGMIYFKNKPLIYFKNNNNKIYYGLIYNTYNCDVYSNSFIKPKWVKYTCPERIDNDNKFTDFKIVLGDSGEDMVYIRGIGNTSDSKQYSIYYYGVESIKISDDDREFELSTALIVELVDIDTLTKNMNKIYDNKNILYGNNDYRILVCKNNDIYIGNTKLVYNEEYCL